MFLQGLNSIAKKNLKFINWLQWIEKKLARRGILADTDSCAYGKAHLVSRAEKIGGGWMFYSQGCSGCAISRLGLDAKENKKPLPKGAPNCALLVGPLFSMTEVKNGKKITLPLVTAEEPSNPLIKAIDELRKKKIHGSNVLSHRGGSGGGTQFKWTPGKKVKIGTKVFNPEDLVELEISGVIHKIPALKAKQIIIEGDYLAEER